MSIYAIGDIQGCYDPLLALLDKIKYDPSQDELWFVGDLVNRGPKSLEILRFIKSLPNVRVVLGNHDLHLLALVYEVVEYHQHTLDDVLNAPDREELAEWLRTRPVLYYHPPSNFVMVHAGLIPQWNVQQAIERAAEVEAVLQGPLNKVKEFLSQMYGNYPDIWDKNLKSWERLRFITNVLTRIRYCSIEGRLDLVSNGPPGTQPPGFMPWFEVPHSAWRDHRIVFGHWAALLGKVYTPDVYGIDTGCVWGNCLTALKVDDCSLINVSCT